MLVLCIEVTYTRHETVLSQRKHVQDLLTETSMLGSNPIDGS